MNESQRQYFIKTTYYIVSGVLRRNMNNRLTPDIPKNKAFLVGLPVDVGVTPLVDALRPYFNRELYTPIIKYRGGRSRETTKIPKYQWDFAYRSGTSAQDLKALGAETASLYVTKKSNFCEPLNHLDTISINDYTFIVDKILKAMNVFNTKGRVDYYDL